MAIGDDQELFDAAMSDKPAPTPAPEPPAKEPEPQAPAEGDRPRDEHGRFAPKQEAAPAAPPAQAQPAATQPAPAEPEPRQDHRIPLAEHLSVRERAQNAERERDAERQSRADLERRLQMMERQLGEARQPKKETPDVWADPGAYVDAKLEPIRSGQEAVLERMSRAFAVDKYGAEAVNAAMSELERQMLSNPQARFEHQRIMASDHPYGELVTWHKRQNVLKEIGEDPAAYKARVLEDAKKDPAFVAAIVEAARQQAQQPAANGQPRSPNVSLPPSLNRQTGSGGAAIDAVPKTDGEIFAGMFPR